MSYYPGQYGAPQAYVPQYGAPPQQQHRPPSFQHVERVLAEINPKNPPFVPEIPLDPYLAQFLKEISGTVARECQVESTKNPIRTYFYNLISANNFANPLFTSVVTDTIYYFGLLMATEKVNDPLDNVTAAARRMCAMRSSAMYFTDSYLIESTRGLLSDVLMENLTTARESYPKIVDAVQRHQASMRAPQQPQPSYPQANMYPPNGYPHQPAPYGQPPMHHPHPTAYPPAAGTPYPPNGGYYPPNHGHPQQNYQAVNPGQWQPAPGPGGYYPPNNSPYQPVTGHQQPVQHHTPMNTPTEATQPYSGYKPFTPYDPAERTNKPDLSRTQAPSTPSSTQRVYGSFDNTTQQPQPASTQPVAERSYTAPASATTSSGGSFDVFVEEASRSPDPEKKADLSGFEVGALYPIETTRLKWQPSATQPCLPCYNPNEMDAFLTITEDREVILKLLRKERNMDFDAHKTADMVAYEQRMKQLENEVVAKTRTHKASEADDSIFVFTEPLSEEGSVVVEEIIQSEDSNTALLSHGGAYTQVVKQSGGNAKAVFSRHEEVFVKKDLPRDSINYWDLALKATSLSELQKIVQNGAIEGRTTAKAATLLNRVITKVVNEVLRVEILAGKARIDNFAEDLEPMLAGVASRGVDTVLLEKLVLSRLRNFYGFANNKILYAKLSAEDPVGKLSFQETSSTEDLLAWANELGILILEKRYVAASLAGTLSESGMGSEAVGEPMMILREIHPLLYSVVKRMVKMKFGYPNQSFVGYLRAGGDRALYKITRCSITDNADSFVISRIH